MKRSSNASRDEDAGEGASNRPNKKKNKQRHEGGRKPTEGTPDHFEKLLEGPCLSHAFPIKHLYKDYGLMRWFLSGGSTKGEHRRDPKLAADNAEGEDGGFTMLDSCLMIFGGLAAYDS